MIIKLFVLGARSRAAQSKTGTSRRIRRFENERDNCKKVSLTYIPWLRVCDIMSYFFRAAQVEEERIRYATDQLRFKEISLDELKSRMQIEFHDTLERYTNPTSIIYLLIYLYKIQAELHGRAAQETRKFGAKRSAARR